APAPHDRGARGRDRGARRPRSRRRPGSGCLAARTRTRPTTDERNGMDLSLRTKGGLLAVLGTAAVLGVLALTIALAGPEDSASAKANYCNSLDNLATTVVNYQGLNPATATNDQLQSAADDIDGAWNDVVDDANDWANAYDNPLGNAVDDLANA